LAGNAFDAKSESRSGDLAVRRSDLKSVMAHYSKALQVQPDDADTNLGMAKVLTAMHQLKGAEPYLARAATLEPFNAATHYRLGVLYRELGRADDAHRELGNSRSSGR
jgi:Flp pilus assembly protein TadD